MTNLLSRKLCLGVLLCAVAACGDISNEDLEFMAVLPDQSLTVALPATSGSTPDGDLDPDNLAIAADAASRINLVSQLIGKDARAIVVRRPTVRRTGHREWGPFAVAGLDGFYDLVMDRAASVGCSDPDDPLEPSASGYTWTVEASVSESGTYAPLVSGTVSGLDFSHSCGTMTFQTAVSRALDGGETDADPNTINLTWTRGPHATRLTSTVDASPSGDGILVENTTYEFRSVVTGYGHFTYAERYHPASAPLTTHILQAVTEWGPDGKPWRVDSTDDDATRSPISHGVACGPVFGESSFQEFDEPISTPIDPTDPNCTFDYSPGD